MNYDMNVEYDTVCMIEKKIKQIRQNVSESTDCMVYALRNAADYLAGEQYGKACENTLLCAESAKKTVDNLGFLLTFLDSVKDSIELYDGCKYGN